MCVILYVNVTHCRAMCKTQHSPDTHSAYMPACGTTLRRAVLSVGADVRPPTSTHFELGYNNGAHVCACVRTSYALRCARKMKSENTCQQLVECGRRVCVRCTARQM